MPWVYSCFTTWITLLPFLTFQVGCHAFFLGLALDHNPPTYASWIAGITDVYCHAQLVCWDRKPANFFPQACLKLQPSWAPGIANVHHLIFFFFFLLFGTGVWIRALCFLGKPLEPCSWSFVCSCYYFEQGLTYAMRLALVAGMTGTLHHTQLLLVEMGVSQIFACACIELPLSWSLPSE
jgi:hypothetical protein